MFLSSALEWLEDKGATLGHAIVTDAEDLLQAGTGLIAGAEDEIEGGVSAIHDDLLGAVTTVHDDLSDVIHWGGTQVEKGEDLVSHVVDSSEQVVTHAVQELGDLGDRVLDDSYGFANNFVDKGTGMLSTPLTLLAGGALLFLMASGRNSRFSF